MKRNKKTYTDVRVIIRLKRNEVGACSQSRVRPADEFEV